MPCPALPSLLCHGLLCPAFAFATAFDGKSCVLFLCGFQTFARRAIQAIQTIRALRAIRAIQAIRAIRAIQAICAIGAIRAIRAIRAVRAIRGIRATAKAFAKVVFINQERKLGDRRRSDTVLVLTMPTRDWRSLSLRFLQHRTRNQSLWVLGGVWLQG